MKKDTAAELCAVLAFSALQNNDKVGVIFFSDIIEKFIPPKKGRTHILRVVRELLDFKPEHRMTNLTEGLRYLTSAIKKRSIAFLISDFIDDDYEDALKIAARKHDLIGIKLYDPRESELVPIGLMRLVDAESGESVWFDTSDRRAVQLYNQWWKKQQEQRIKLFRKCGVDGIDIRIDQSYINPLINFFRAREKRW